ncbi:hypothetical protein [Streptomyces fradiae]|uniref:hypothetical protein n=1 Tax=Streptomyces fradiae TaxID=1906 RepID=UPI00201A1AC4|nr:hypothetical protein [Streptomyces fradiae]UQS29851.1 hypothetical protein J5J01_23685 [Streptomyces fradiae]
MEEVLAYAAAALAGLWGVAHAVPTRSVVAGFGEISADNRRVLVQEWLAEAVAMWAFAVLVAVVTAVGGGTATAHWTYRVVAGALLVIAALTAATGARTGVVWFKLCPVVLSCSAALLLIASLL